MSSCRGPRDRSSRHCNAASSVQISAWPSAFLPLKPSPAARTIAINLSAVSGVKYERFARLPASLNPRLGLPRLIRATGRLFLQTVERVKGIEPSSSAWKAVDNKTNPHNSASFDGLAEAEKSRISALMLSHCYPTVIPE